LGDGKLLGAQAAFGELRPVGAGVDVLQVVAKRFAFLLEREADEIEERLGGLLIGKREPDNGGVNLWRRPEGAGRDFHYDLDGRSGLCGDAQVTVVAGGWRGAEAVGDLLLNEKYGRLNRGASRENALENRRRDVVGEIAGQRRRSPLGEVGVEDVGVVNMQPRVAGKSSLERGDHQRVEFDGVYVGAGCQQ